MEDKEIRWENDWGNEFEDMEAAREDARERMDDDAYMNELGYLISYDRLLRYAMNNAPGFWDDFADEVADAENEFFHANYHEVIDDD